MIQKIKKQWFLIGLGLVFIAVVFDPSNILETIGLGLKNNHGPEVMIFFIFIVSGLLIDGAQIKSGIKDVKSTILSLVVIIILAPVAALCLSFIPLDIGIIIGLFIVSVMPTTLSSGVVMTGTAGGNMAHALFITIISNFIGIISIPVILSWLLSMLDLEKELVIDQAAIIIKLSFLVLLPLFIGIFAKTYVPYARQIKKFKLQIANQCMIIGIVFISVAGAKQVLLGTGTAFLYIVVLVCLFHLMLLGFSFILVRFFHIKKGRCESIIFMGSQKTLPLSVMIQVTYFSEFGIALLVCVVHHIVHLMMDGYLSTKMSQDL